MKKSQLRKIIRESIKQLMNEQWNPGCESGSLYHKFTYLGFENQYIGGGSNTPNGFNCGPNTTTSYTVRFAPGCPQVINGSPGQTGNFWNYVGQPSPGQVVRLSSNLGTNNSDYCMRYEGADTSMSSQLGFSGMGNSATSVLSTHSSCQDCASGSTSTPCTTYGCTDPTATNYNSTILPNCNDNSCVWLGCTDSTASNYDPTATVDDGSCILGNSGCPTCDSSSWGNHQNWITQFTSMPHFSSSNPNQPCNMICNKIQIWDNNCQNAGPVQANQLACKIEEAQNQSQIHGCNC